MRSRFAVIPSIVLLAATARAATFPINLPTLDPSGRVSVYVVLDGQPAMAVAHPAGFVASALSPNEIERYVQNLSDRQVALEPAIEALDARVTGRFQRLANAIKVEVRPEQLAAIAALPGVIRVDPVGFYHVDNSTSVPFIGAAAVWQRGSGVGDGAGIKIGVIDSGIDYTHADFGGGGRPSDYTSNDGTTIEPGSFPTVKVAGGWDLAGDAYDPSKGTSPAPDPDPLDCPPPTSSSDQRPCGHGTHVAGTIAGYGVTASGATYRGPYSDALDFSQFAIGPGVAPMASLYAIKIFGVGATTGLVGDALEWVAQPGNHMDVVNLSLGCDFSCDSPTELDLVDNLVASGTVVVAAAGNAGNTFFDTGDPANAATAISVAASIDDGIVYPAIQVTQPASIARNYEAIEGAFTEPLSSVGPTSGVLVATEPADACSDLTNAGSISGKIALIDRGTCYFVDKVTKAQAAGAKAVVMVNNVDGEPIIMGGTASGITIPGVMISLADGNTIKPYLGAGVSVRLDSSLTVARPDLADQVASFSARGPVAADGRLKPDIAAPGYLITSAWVGSGNGSAVLSGTSMATPHISGSAALVRQAHPSWTPATIKAALMNTAALTADGSGDRYPESRVGAGRVKVDAAVATSVTAAGDGSTGDVGLSFGSIDAADPSATDRTITLTNHGSAAATYAVGVVPTLANPGVTLTPLVSSVTVPAGGTATVPVRLSVHPNLITATVDATTPATQSTKPRSVLREASGQVTFDDGSGGAALHLPYHAAVGAGSALRDGVGSICLSGSQGTVRVTVPLAGPSANAHPVASAFQLGAANTGMGSGDPANILAVGAACDAARQGGIANATVYFGISTAGSWTTPQTEVIAFQVHIDLDGNGTDDYVVYNDNYATAASADPSNPDDATDTFVTTVKKSGSSTKTIDSFANVFTADQLDTAPYENSVLILPVKAASIGLTATHTSFTYSVRATSISGVVGTTSRVTFDAAHPLLDTTVGGVQGTPIYVDRAPILVDVNASAVSPSNPPKLLLLYHTNVPGTRSEIVTIGGTGSADLALTAPTLPSRVETGQPLAVELVVTNQGPSQASGVTLTDTLPASVQVATTSPSQGSCTVNGSAVVCSLGSIASGASAAVGLVLTPTTTGTLTQTASVTGTGCDPTASNNAIVLQTNVGGAHAIRRRLVRTQ